MALYTNSLSGGTSLPRTTTFRQSESAYERRKVVLDCLVRRYQVLVLRDLQAPPLPASPAASCYSGPVGQRTPFLDCSVKCQVSTKQDYNVLQMMCTTSPRYHGLHQCWWKQWCLSHPAGYCCSFNPVCCSVIWSQPWVFDYSHSSHRLLLLLQPSSLLCDMLSTLGLQLLTLITQVWSNADGSKETTTPPVVELAWAPEPAPQAQQPLGSIPPPSLSRQGPPPFPITPRTPLTVVPGPPSHSRSSVIWKIE